MAQAGLGNLTVKQGSVDLKKTSTGWDLMVDEPAVVKLSSLDLAVHEKLNIRQTNDQSSLHIIVESDQQPAHISGHLTANGQVRITGPSGFVIGPEAKADFHQLQLITISDGWSDDPSKPNSHSSIINHGTFNGHRLIMQADQVSHWGRIQANEAQLEGMAGGQLKMAGQIDASHPSGTGGTIKLLGGNIQIDNQAGLNASGHMGGGRILIGGDFKGQNPEVQNAQTTTVAQGVRIQADAIHSGLGGQVIVWSDVATVFQGTISATGGELNGDGGLVEVSSKQSWQFPNWSSAVDVSSHVGDHGTFLIDPNDISIVDGSGSAIPSSPTNANILNDQDIVDFLTNTGSLVIETTGTGGNGDIMVTSGVDLTWSTTNELTLDADRDIVFQASSTVSASAGADINLLADGDLTVDGDVSTAGGDVSITASDVSSFAGSIDVGAGNLLITAVADRDIRLGTTGGTNLGLANTTLNNLTTSGGLRMVTTGAGNIEVQGVTAAATDLITGAVTLDPSGTGDVLFEISASTFSSALFVLDVGDVDSTIVVDQDIIIDNNDITFSGPITLTNAVAIDTGTGSGDLTINGQVSGGSNSLALIAGAGSTAVNAAMNGIDDLQLQQDAATSTGNVNLNDNITATSLTTFSQAYNVALLGANNTITTSTQFFNTGSVTFGDSASDTTTFESGLDAASFPSSNSLSGTLQTNNAALTLAALTLTGESVLDTGFGSGDLTLTGTVVGGSNDLQLVAGSGNISVSGMINGVHDLLLVTSSQVDLLDVTSDGVQNVFGGNIDLNGSDYQSLNSGIVFNGAVDLLAASTTTVTSGGNSGDDITFNNVVQGDSSSNLTLSTGSGDLSVNGAIGLDGNPIGSLIINANDINLGGDVDSSSIELIASEATDPDSIDITGINLDANGGNINLSSDDLITGGTSTFSSTGAVGATITFTAESNATRIEVGDNTSGLIALSLSETDLQAVESSFSELIIGADSVQSGLLEVNESGGLQGLNTSLRLRSEAGMIEINSAIDLSATTSSGLVTEGPASLAEDLTTASGSINFIGSVQIGQGLNIKLDTTNNGAVSGALITAADSFNGTAGGASEALTLDAGTAGSVQFNGPFGDLAPIATLTIDQSNGVIFQDQVTVGSVVVLDTNSGQTIGFLGDTQLTSGLFTTTQDFNLSFTGANNSLAGLTSFNNAGTVVLGDEFSDSTTFTAGLSLPAQSTLLIALNDPIPSDVSVDGGLTLGAQLEVDLSFLPGNGDEFIIINNDGTDPVSNTFNGLPEGAFVSGLAISYVAGTGNDVSLTFSGDGSGPVALSSVRQNPVQQITSANAVRFRVTFDEDVVNVDASDFVVNSLSTANVTGVTAISASIYDVTISGGNLGNFDGELGLDFAPTQDIFDLVNNGFDGAEPAIDETYLLDNTNAELVISKTDNNEFIDSGALIDYVITVQNLGPADIEGADVNDLIPAGLSAASWVCTPDTGASCTASGNGDLVDSIDLNPGTQVVYTLSATVSAPLDSLLENTVTVDPPVGIVDPDANNNTATDQTLVDVVIFENGFEDTGTKAVPLWVPQKFVDEAPDPLSVIHWRSSPAYGDQWRQSVWDPLGYWVIGHWQYLD